MPTNYTGNYLGVQSPAIAPDSETDPVLVLPNAGDPATSASVAQAFKVLADYVAWQRSPRALAGQWRRPIKVFRNAQSAQRFLIDHQGLPSGHILQWDEDWGQALQPSIGASIPNVAFGVTPRFSGFRYATAGNGQLVFIDGSSLVHPAQVSPAIELYTDNSSNGADVNLYSTTAIYATADIALSWQFDVFVGYGPDIASCEFFCGLISATATSAGRVTLALPVGAGFVKRPGEVVWSAYFKPAGGTDTVFSLSTPATSATRYRFRIELTGASSSDNGVAQMALYINDVWLTQQPVPIVGYFNPYFRVTRTAVGTNSGEMYVGPNQFRAYLP